MYSFLWRKLVWQLDTLSGYAQYPFRRRELLDLMSRSMGSVNIETTNICNADCIFCAYQYQERPTGVQDMALTRKIIDEFVECGGGSVQFTPTVGDPLVDKHILERIRYARSKPEVTWIHIYSNLISLDRFDVDEFMTSGLTSLTVSTSGLDEEMYQRLYRSKMYKKVIANIKLLARENNKRGKPMKIMVDMRVDKPMREITKYPDYLEVVELLGAENMLCKFRYDSWAGKIKQEQLSGNMKLRKGKPHITPCSELFGGPMVYWDGKVGACNCRDVNASELIIGDVTRDHLGDIYFGEELKKLREEFLTDKRRDLCRNCTQYNNLTHLLKHSSKWFLPAGPSPYYAKARPVGARSSGVSLKVIGDDHAEGACCSSHDDHQAHAHDEPVAVKN